MHVHIYSWLVICTHASILQIWVVGIVDSSDQTALVVLSVKLATSLNLSAVIVMTAS